METNQSSLLPIIELFKKAFNIYQSKAWFLFRVVVFGLLGCLIMVPLGLIVFAISFTSFKAGHFDPKLILIDALLLLVGLFFCIMFELWARVALLYSIKKDVGTLKQTLSLSWSKIGAFFWVSFLMGLANLAGFILFIIPGIIFSVWFVFSAYVFVFEDIKGVSALKRSKELVRGRWWPVFGRIFAIIAVSILVSWIKFFGPIINIFFVAPFSIVYLYTLYEELKSKG